MFRTKFRIHTCRVILLTSLVWFLVDVVVLTFYSDCVGGSGWGCGNAVAKQPAAPPEALQLVQGAQHVVGGSKGRGILNEQGKDQRDVDGVMVDKEKYKQSELKRWRPAPPVAEHARQPGEMGKPVHIPAEQENLMKEKFKLNQFNLLASDMISLNRSLADVRLSGYVFYFVFMEILWFYASSYAYSFQLPVKF
ncbi:hypothetical protein PR048_032622 [Dryococelus australis]|uniref:Uncharacterized protein n=1 Tax=Dryococelus australis TaxID=614101 RepID=A0ABQ9G6X4_9NEOP|nr:hypothetical protein PR048_032622 [Dryococelus australis]